jgi:hypothetical protein
VARYGTLMTLWLLSAPVVGVSLFFLSRTTWYVFLVHSSLVLVDFVVKIAIRPAFYFESLPPTNTVLLFAGNLALVTLIGYVIQRDFRSPYFQLLQRAFREHERIPIHQQVQVGGASAMTSDVSAGGCFLPAEGLEYHVGDRMPISFTMARTDVSCEGEVMRAGADGYGIKFHHLARRSRLGVARILRDHFALRYKVAISAVWQGNSAELSGTLINISKGGCYLEAGTTGVDSGSSGRVELALNGDRYRVPAKVAWVNSDAEYDKPNGFGLRFRRGSRRLMRRVNSHQELKSLTR